MFILLGCASFIFTGSIFSFANIGGIVPDLLLLIALSTVFMEKTSAPIVFAAVTGLIYDVMFSSYIGFYALSYTLTIAIAYMLLRKMERMKPFLLALIGFAAYIVKESVQAGIVSALGVDFSYFYMIVRYILPGALVTAVLMYPAYYLIRILYVRNLMSPTKSLYDDF